MVIIPQSSCYAFKKKILGPKGGGSTRMTMTVITSCRLLFSYEVLHIADKNLGRGPRQVAPGHTVFHTP
jgi:hypothetical protein